MKDHWDLGFLCCSGGHEKKNSALAGISFGILTVTLNLQM